jgi:hypothetical protein
MYNLAFGACPHHVLKIFRCFGIHCSQIFNVNEAGGTGLICRSCSGSKGGGVVHGAV